MAQFKPADDFKLRDSAIRSAKRIHGANWKDTHEVVAVGDRFVVKALVKAEPVNAVETPAPVAVAPVVETAPVEPIKAEVIETPAPVVQEAPVVVEAVEAAPVAAATKPTKAKRAASSTADDMMAALQLATGKLKTTVAAVVPVKAPANATAPVQNKQKQKHAGGRPPSEAQLKIRRRVLAWIAKTTGTYTPKQCASALKANKVHVMNALRWADETAGLIKLLGYADQNGRPGRPSRLYETLPAGRVVEKEAA